MVLEIVIFFALLLVTTMITALLPGTISARFWVTLPVCALALATTAATFVGIEHDGPGATALGLCAILLTLIMRGLQPQWSFLGAQLFAAVAVASLSYLVYASFQTFFAGRHRSTTATGRITHTCADSSTASATSSTSPCRRATTATRSSSAAPWG